MQTITLAITIPKTISIEQDFIVTTRKEYMALLRAKKLHPKPVISITVKRHTD